MPKPDPHGRLPPTASGRPFYWAGSASAGGLRSAAVSKSAKAALQCEVATTSARWAPVAALLRRAARAAARAEGFARGRLSVAVVGARRMATLHRRHRGVAGTTDVLTFDLGTDRRRGWIEGEIIVCGDVAQQSAARTLNMRQRAAAVAAELALYVVHGVLHLAGHDDGDARGFARMHAREDEILTRLGLGPVFSRGAPSRPARAARRRAPGRRRKPGGRPASRRRTSR